MTPEAYEQAKIIFLGVAGGFAVEIRNVHATFEAGRRFPARYTKPWFWTNRCLLSFMGGLLAWAYGVTNPILAFHVGASTPLIIDTFAKGPPGEVVK